MVSGLGLDLGDGVSGVGDVADVDGLTGVAGGAGEGFRLADLIAMLGLSGLAGGDVGSANADLVADLTNEDGSGLRVGESLDSDGIADSGDFRVHNTLAPSVSTDAGDLDLSNRVQVTDEQAHINTHIVGVTDDSRLGDYTGVDLYYTDLTDPSAQVHETVNLDAQGMHQALDQHLTIPS